MWSWITGTTEENLDVKDIEDVEVNIKKTKLFNELNEKLKENEKQKQLTLEELQDIAAPLIELQKEAMDRIGELKQQKPITFEEIQKGLKDYDDSVSTTIINPEMGITIKEAFTRPSSKKTIKEELDNFNINSLTVPKHIEKPIIVDTVKEELEKNRKNVLNKGYSKMETPYQLNFDDFERWVSKNLKIISILQTGESTMGSYDRAEFIILFYDRFISYVELNNYGNPDVLKDVFKTVNRQDSSFVNTEFFGNFIKNRLEITDQVVQIVR